MLSALQTIDILLQGNQIHFQILAAVPALLFFTYGTPLFLRSLYNIRSRDLRPIRAVHGEMHELLQMMEELLLVSSGPGDDNDDHESKRSRPLPVSSSPSHSSLNPRRVGEFVLYMHRYLLLLDFASPPFPARQCNAIHTSLHNVMDQLPIVGEHDQYPEPPARAEADSATDGGSTRSEQAARMTPSSAAAALSCLRLVQRKHQDLDKYL
jgi:ATP synthase regulation protein NCA2